MSVKAETHYDQAIVEQLQLGNKKTFEDLYNNYSAMIYGVVTRIVENEDIACEIVQDVFLKVWKNISQYDGSKGRLSTWMLNIARNRAIDELRSKNFKQQSENQNIEDSVRTINQENRVNQRVDTIGLKQVTHKLRFEHQALVDLIYFQGYTHEEAARELNIPLGTVKTRIRSAIIELRKMLRVEQ